VRPTALQIEKLTFRAAGYFRHELRVSNSLLLFLVSTNRIRVRQTSTYPVYCLEDVERFLREEYPRDAQSRYAAVRRQAAQLAATAVASRGVARA
jgi:hypothetical protein